jgi:hypothetical protein
MASPVALPNYLHHPLFAIHPDSNSCFRAQAGMPQPTTVAQDKKPFARFRSASAAQI